MYKKINIRMAWLPMFVKQITIVIKEIRPVPEKA
jgi:hypothetical protein